MYAASIVDIVVQVLFVENLPHSVTPPVRSVFTNVPEEIPMNHRDRVKEIGGTAVSNELMPMGLMLPIAKHRNAEVSAKVARKMLAVTVEDRLAE
jgi:hypothetical protein